MPDLLAPQLGAGALLVIIRASKKNGEREETERIRDRTELENWRKWGRNGDGTHYRSYYAYACEKCIEISDDEGGGLEFGLCDGCWKDEDDEKYDDDIMR